MALREHFELTGMDGNYLTVRGTCAVLKELPGVDPTKIALLESTFDAVMARRYLLHAEKKSEFDELKREEPGVKNWLDDVQRIRQYFSPLVLKKLSKKQSKKLDQLKCPKYGQQQNSSASRRTSITKGAIATVVGVGISAGFAGIGAALGSLVFPGVGTAIGAVIGAGVGASDATTVLAIAKVASPMRSWRSRLLTLGVSSLISAGIGAAVGSIVFPGLGSFVGAAIGAGVGLGLNTLGVTAAVGSATLLHEENLKANKLVECSSTKELRNDLNSASSYQYLNAVLPKSECYSSEDNYSSDENDFSDDSDFSDDNDLSVMFKSGLELNT